MKKHLSVEVQIHAFLISTLHRGERSASRHGRFTLELRVPDTHWIRRLGGLQSWSERCGKLWTGFIWLRI